MTPAELLALARDGDAEVTRAGVVGRDAELTCVRAFVDEAGDGPAALVLQGEAGIGKSTLWLRGVEHAIEKGRRVLSARPAEAERALGHAALGDLLESALDETLPSLPPPRRHALETVMLRADDAGDPVDRRALALAVRDMLHLLAERQALLIAIDDEQWLDHATSGALSFALRRLPDSDVRVLLARRVGGGAPSGIEDALTDSRRLSVGPLSPDTLHQLLRDGLDRSFARQTLLRIHERSGGNPFYALELARVLDADVDPLEPLPVPETLDGLLRARIAGLPTATREALALASALGTATVPLLERAGVSADALEPAAAAHVIEHEGGAIRFSHPLLSSVMYRDLGEARRAIHDRIARSVDDPLLRARHLALSTDVADAETIAVLDDAVALALNQGAPAVAAELAEHAVRLTPKGAGGDRRHRALAAARAHQAAGEWTRARTIAADLLADAAEGSWRAEALVLLSELESIDRAAELLDEALRESASRPALQSLVHCRLAWVRRFRRGFEHAAAALELAEQLGDDELCARARAVQMVLGWFAGTTEVSNLPALIHHLPIAVGGERPVQEATQALANTFAASSARGEARAVFEQEHRDWRDRDEPRSARALWGLAWLEFWAGRWHLAGDHAARAHDIAIQYGLEVPQDHLPIAVVAVHQGDFERARAHSERALALAEEQFGFPPPQHLAVMGLVALGSGDRAGALALLEASHERAGELRWGEPSLRWWTSDHTELLLELGRIDDADRLVAAWEEDAERTGRDWVLARARGCRGLVAAARGDVDNALALLADAVSAHEAVDEPFGRARALLALGTVRRRARQKLPARQAIQAALEGFEMIGASTWAAKARAELGRVGGRTRAAGLTTAERRVAALVAEGRTNREVAAALYLAERTIASHLTHIYAKLGVRSRSELVRRLRV